MILSRHQLFLVVLTLCGLLVAQKVVFSEVPLSEDFSSREEAGRLLWTEKAADGALQSGISSLAEGLYLQILNSFKLSESAEKRVKNKLISSLISQGRMEEVQKWLDEFKEPFNASFYVRRALWAYHSQNFSQMREDLMFVAESSLSDAELSWYYVLKGLVAENDGTKDVAERLFSQALENSVSVAQRAEIDILIKRGQIAAGEINDALVADLLEKYKQTEGTRVGHSYAKEYAIVLDSIGRTTEALNILQNQLQYILAEEKAESDQMQLLIALIAGEQTTAGREALQGILVNPGTSEISQLALHLLSSSPKTEEELLRFVEFLNVLIGDTPPGDHPLQDRLLFMRSNIRFASGDLVGAAADAERLMENFPGSAFRKDALWLNAYVAWSDEPPRYRISADLLTRLKEEVKSKDELLMLSGLIADCYYLNGDFETASNLYLSALNEFEPSDESEALLFKLVDASIQLEKYTEAGNYLDDPKLLVKAGVEERWQAEWNLVDALKNSGKTTEAFERLNRKLEEEGTNTPPLLLMRMMWLKASLSVQMGNEQQIREVASIADGIIELAGRLEQRQGPNEQIQNVISHTLLLKGRGWLKLGVIESALEIFVMLREQFPDSQPAILSYLEEARYYAGQDRIADAQRLSVTLADQYPESEYAPIALYDAALQAKKQVLERHQIEAKDLLEKLCSLYPDHGLAFYARLNQGDILRGLNNFGDAQKVYDYLINNYPEHPEIYLAELYRARCLLAQSSRNQLLLDEAAAGLERLLDLPNAPVELKIESGYTLGLVLVKQEKFLRAKEVFWQLIHRYLKEGSDLSELGTKGPLWMARAIFDLGELLEVEEKTEDARKVYGYIFDFKLPGRSLAKARLE